MAPDWHAFNASRQNISVCSVTVRSQVTAIYYYETSMPLLTLLNSFLLWLASRSLSSWPPAAAATLLGDPAAAALLPGAAPKLASSACTWPTSSSAEAAAAAEALAAASPLPRATSRTASSSPSISSCIATADNMVSAHTSLCHVFVEERPLACCQTEESGGLRSYMPCMHEKHTFLLAWRCSARQAARTF